MGQKHSVSIYGGVQDMAYGINLMCNNIMGVMKGSGRNANRLKEISNSLRLGWWPWEWDAD